MLQNPRVSEVLACLHHFVCLWEYTSLSCLCWSSRNVIIYLLVCVYTVGDVCMCSSGPGQYDLSVKSFPPTALISSREDRFRVSMNTNPGPSAYQVNMLLHLHVTLLKHYFPTHSHSTSLLDQPTFSNSALTSVYVWTHLLSEFTSYISMWPIVSICSNATDILYVSEYLMFWLSWRGRNCLLCWIILIFKPNFSSFCGFGTIATEETQSWVMWFLAQGSSFSHCERSALNWPAWIN